MLKSITLNNVGKDDYFSKFLKINIWIYFIHSYSSNCVTDFIYTLEDLEWEKKVYYNVIVYIYIYEIQQLCKKF